MKCNFHYHYIFATCTTYYIPRLSGSCNICYKIYKCDKLQLVNTSRMYFRFQIECMSILDNNITISSNIVYSKYSCLLMISSSRSIIEKDYNIILHSMYAKYGIGISFFYNYSLHAIGSTKSS